MTSDLLQQLEQKVAHAVEVIELLRLQLEELEVENLALKTEHEKWRKDLAALLKRFDNIDFGMSKDSHSVSSPEEEYMTV